MQFRLAKFKEKIRANSGVYAVVDLTDNDLVIASPDCVFSDEQNCETVRRDAVDFLPLSISLCSGVNEYIVENTGADESFSVGIYLVFDKCYRRGYDIVRRDNGRDTVLTEGALSLGLACNVLAACNEINWQCLFTNSGDLETVCVANALAILENLEAA